MANAKVIIVSPPGGTGGPPPPPPPPPPGQDILFGASAGAHAATTFARLSPNITRTFSTGVWSAMAGIPICHSEKPGSVMANTGAAGYTSAVNSLRSTASSLPDIPGQRFAVHHEPVDDGMSGATWTSIQVNTRNDVINVVNASRVNPIKLVGILNGNSANPSDGGAYYSPACIAAVHEVGADFYNLPALNAGIAWFQSLGVTNWCIPELGYEVADPGHTDTQVKNFIDDSVDIFNAAYRPPVWVSWFNNLENCLVTKLNAATSVGATSFSVTNGLVPSGASVVVDTGANAETVTVGSFTGSTTRTYSCSALTKAHTSSAPVYLRPNSAAAWLALDLASAP